MLTSLATNKLIFTKAECESEKYSTWQKDQADAMLTRYDGGPVIRMLDPYPRGYLLGQQYQGSFVFSVSENGLSHGNDHAIITSSVKTWPVNDLGKRDTICLLNLISSTSNSIAHIAVDLSVPSR